MRGNERKERVEEGMRRKDINAKKSKKKEIIGEKRKEMREEGGVWIMRGEEDERGGMRGGRRVREKRERRISRIKKRGEREPVGRIRQRKGVRSEGKREWKRKKR